MLAFNKKKKGGRAREKVWRVPVKEIKKGTQKPKEQGRKGVCAPQDVTVLP